MESPSTSADATGNAAVVSPVSNFRNIPTSIQDVIAEPEAIKIPLCAYIEEEVREPKESTNSSESGVFRPENGAFMDPQLGCVSCQLQPYEQCVKRPRKSCQMAHSTDLDCQLCPKKSAHVQKKVAFDITDENEMFEKCDGNVTRDKLGRLVVFETKCKKFSSSRYS